MDIILASRSPRRRELLQAAGVQFRVVPGSASEECKGLRAEDLVVELSRRKAAEVAFHLRSHDPQPGSRLVIGADTLVLLGGEIMGKPRDPADASQMLHLLSGREHRVLTGLALILQKEGQEHQVCGWEETRVRFGVLSPEVIRQYVDTGEPLDKAGAYGIQGQAALFVEGIRGCYSNVVGLPLHRLYQLAAALGVNLLDPA